MPRAIQTIPDDTVTKSGYGLQKHQLTHYTGKAINLPNGTDLNTITANGFYDGIVLTNAPVSGNIWYYIEVQQHSGGDTYVLQKASLLSGGSGDLPVTYQRVKKQGGWSNWTELEGSNKKNIANGYAGLDANADVLDAQIPPSVARVADMLSNAGGDYTGPMRRVYSGLSVQRDLAALTNSSASVTGTIKITLPVSWTNTMMTLKIKGFDYGTPGGAWEILLGGYNFSTTPGWVYTSAVGMGDIPFTNVRFAHDGTKCCILLGTLNQVWKYPKVIVAEMMSSHNSTGFASGWSVTLETLETGITVSSDIPVTNNPYALTGTTGMGKTGNPTISPNTLLETGMHTLTFSSPDLPIAGSTTTVIVKRYNSSYITQDADVYATVNGFTTIRKFTRETRNNGTDWSSWREISMKASNLPNNVNLNSLIEGEYFAVSNASAATHLNMPTDVAGMSYTIKVSRNVGDGLTQVLTTYVAASPRIFVRNAYNGVYGPWYEIETARTKNTAGGYAGLDSNGDVLLSAIPDTVQKFSLTQDNGKNLILESGYNLNSLVTAGFYDGVNLVNAPNSTNWWHIQVQVHSGTNNGNDYISQIAINLNASGTPHHFMRRRVNSAWGAWVGIPNSSMYNAPSGIAGLTAGGFLPDSILPQSVTRRVNLTGSLQTTSYRRSVIALCELTNTNPSASSFSNGLLLMRRHNGLNGQITAMIAAEKRFNTTAMNWSLFKIGASSQVFRPCTFTYNGVKYGGIDVYITDAEYQTISFNGDTNFSIFGLDWYNIQSSTVLNAEISGSISYVEGTDYFYSPDIHFNGENLNTKYSTLAGKTLAEVVQGSLSYAVTTGTYAVLAASLNPAPAALTVGLRLTIKAHIASPGPATLNVNGLGAKSIKKPNGNNAALALGGVYTLVYDGSVFQLQGEGGEYGTAGAAQTLEGYNVGTENGLVNGSMANNGAGGTVTPTASAQSKPAGYYSSPITIAAVSAPANKILSDTAIAGVTGTVPIITSGSDPAQGVGLWADGGLAVYPSEGYRKGGAGAGEIKVSTAQLQSAEADLIAANIRSGVNVFGVVGTLVEGKRYASNVIVSPPANLSVTGLGFTVRMVSLSFNRGSDYYQYVGVAGEWLYRVRYNSPTGQLLETGAFTSTWPSGGFAINTSFTDISMIAYVAYE